MCIGWKTEAQNNQLLEISRMNNVKTCLLAVAVCFLPMTAIAQISADGSTSTTVDTNGNVSTIDAGEQAGGNLFHSFSEFSVPNGNEAFFDNALDIENIISRVTGGNISNIDGLIRANGSANLFLVNPAGVIFNDGARLDIGGSFFGSTADSVLFPDSVEFSASNPVEPVLTVNAPIGLNLRDNPGDIAVNGSSLGVDPGQSLSLVGGEITFDGSNLNAPEGTISLGSVAEAGTVAFTESGLNFGDLLLDNISSNGTTVNVNQGGSGSITVNANNLTLSDRSIFNGGINSATSTPQTQAGDVTINVAENLTLRSGSLIRNNLSTVSSGNAGDILVTAKNLSLDDASRIVTISQGRGNTGNIELNVLENTQLNREAEIKSQVLPGAIGDGGNIELTTGSLNLTASSLIFSNVSGTGNAGNINLIASDRISLNNSNFQARVESGGVGNSGNITISTDSLEMRDTIQDDIQSTILTGTAGEGDAGNISITAANNISLEDASSIQTQVQPEGIGTGGNIEIVTNSLSLIGESPDTNGQSSLLANSSGEGNAGNITITAAENVSLDQFSLILSQGTANTGDAGDITIDTPQLLLDTRSLIISNTGDAESPIDNIVNIGDAGDINIDSQNITIDTFSAIVSNSLRNATGEAGNLTINTDNLTIEGGSTINSLTGNSSKGGTIEVDAQNIRLVTGGKIVTLTERGGDAGNINLNASQQITIDGKNTPIPTEEFRSAEEAIQDLEPNTGLFANTTQVSTGNGGNVQIANPAIISIANGGEIFVGSQGRGAGGNLSIQANSLSLDNNALLIAETEFGQPQQQPSNINLDIEDLITLRGDSIISARAFNNANGGNVTIDTNFVIAFPASTEGNDIVANASEGSGGNINITAEAVLGLEERRSTLGNGTNDLDVSSQFGFDGNLSLNTPDVDATEGVRELPVGAIAADDRVEQACSATSVNSSLSFAGRGNIPRKPTDVLSSNYIVNSEPTSEISENYPEAIEPIATAVGNIYPARGLKVTDTGAIILTRSTVGSLRTPAKSSCLLDREQ